MGAEKKPSIDPTPGGPYLVRASTTSAIKKAPVNTRQVMALCRCTDGLPSVFRLNQEPWIDSNGANPDEILATVLKCPSGTLSYFVAGREHRDREGPPAILVSENGPYVITSSPDLLNTSRGEGASTQHFPVCRCDASKNKPFCDGTHWHVKFIDEDN